eukprot:1828920-Pyramimonas_sp.AAC.1
MPASGSCISGLMLPRRSAPENSGRPTPRCRSSGGSGSSTGGASAVRINDAAMANWSGNGPACCCHL